MRYISRVVFALIIVGMAVAGPQSANYQLPVYGLQAGGNSADSTYTLAYSAVPAEIAGPASASGYSTVAGLSAMYGDSAAPTMSTVAVLSAMTVYNVADVFQIAFTVSKTLTANPTVLVSGRTATFVSLSNNNYTYQLPVIYGDSGNPVIDVSGLDLDGNTMHVTQTVTAVVVDTALKAPTNFVGYYDTPNHTYKLSWDKMPNQTGYVVEVKLGTYPWTIFNTLPTDATNFNDTNFLEGVNTQYRIKAIYEQSPANIDDSLYTTLAQSVFVPLSAPVVTVGTFDKDQHQVNISWTPGSPSTYQYVIKRSVNGGLYADYVTVPSVNTTYADTNVNFGMTYQYQIIAQNQFGGQSNPQVYQPVNAGRIPIPAGADYHYDVVGGIAGQDAADTGKINLVRDMNGTVTGYMNIDAAALGINLMTASLNMIEITRNASTGILQFVVPTATAVASAVNNDVTHSKKVPVTFTGLPTDKTPIIYVNDKAITDANLNIKPEYADYVGNIVWNSSVGILSFNVTHFSTYTIGLVAAVSFTQTLISQPAGSQAIIGIVVKDNLNDTVANAPVVVRIESGAGTFLGGGTQLTVATDASGNAYVTAVLPNTTGNISIVSATIDGVTANPVCQVIVGNGTIPSLDSDHDGMPDVWEIAHGLNPNDPADAALDPDNDGLTNLQEYRHGTDPHVADTDHDGVLDGYDAYPLDPTRFQFNSTLVKSSVVAENFSGSAVNAPINSYAADIVVSYQGGATNGLANGIPSITDLSVQKISGLTDPRIEDGGLGEQYLGNMYAGLIPGEQYRLCYKFVNRGNSTDTYQIQSNLQQAGNRWSVNAPAAVVVSPWQVAAANIVVAPATALAMESVTLNVGVALALDTAVQYSAFSGAFTGGTYNNEGVYGGVQSVASQAYILQAEGYNVDIVTRSMNIINPNGVTVDAANVVPGSLIKYTIVLRNHGNATASDVIIADKVPQNCHLYYSQEPTVNGAVSATWEGATSNAAIYTDVNAIRFRLTISPQTMTTLSYAVSVD